MNTQWDTYQEDAANFFRSLKMQATTNTTVRGVRTTHDVDVLVKSHQAGFEVTWIVECKLWSSRVSKVHVLALREIVADVGADRGILLAESGVQSGAIEAATLTNVRITTLTDLRNTASAEVFSMRIVELVDRIMICKEQYWDIPKARRIEYGLRGEVGVPNYYWGDKIIEISDELVKKALQGRYPIQRDEFLIRFAPQLPATFDSVESLVVSVELLITELEQKLTRCREAL